MKTNFLYVVLLLVMLSSCSRKSYTTLYHKNTPFEPKDTKYYLPKNVLKFEVIYTLNEPRVQKGAIDEALSTSSTKVTIEDPIVITKLLVADESKTFLITGKQLSEASFVNVDNDENDRILEETLNISLEKNEAVTGQKFSSFTDSSVEAEAYSAVLEIKNNISKIKTKEENKLTLNIVSFYKSQFKSLNEDFQPYIKKHKVKYTVIIDPSELYSKDGNWSNIEGDKIYHTIFPEHVFKEKGILNDVITVKVTKPDVPLLEGLENHGSIDGIVYRTSSASSIEILLNDYSLSKDTLALAQLGQFKTVSAKKLQKEKMKSVVLFKSEDSENTTNTTTIFKEKVEPLAFDSSEIMAVSQKAIQVEYKEKLKNIDLLLKKLKEREAEL